MQATPKPMLRHFEPRCFGRCPCPPANVQHYSLATMRPVAVTRVGHHSSGSEVEGEGGSSSSGDVMGSSTATAALALPGDATPKAGPLAMARARLAKSCLRASCAGDGEGPDMSGWAGA